jgi:hypothetical protein
MGRFGQNYPDRTELFLTQRTSFLWLLMGVEGLAIGEKTRKEVTGIIME